MSDTADTFNAFKQQRTAEKAERRAVAANEYEPAKKLAAANGLGLTQHSDAHYKLVPFLRDRELCATWEINVYPGNRRIYSPDDRQFVFLNLPDGWGLLDVVKKVVAVLEEV